MIRLITLCRLVAPLCFVMLLANCASDSQSPSSHKADSPQTTIKPGGDSTQTHLLTPESQEDLTVLSDAELESRMAAKRREIGRHINEAGNYMLDHFDRDLASDRGYHDILRRAKQADTDLNVLEREVERRESARAKAG